MSAKSKQQHEEPASHERWLITYADMITLLMVFFIVMYSMANTDLKKFAAVAVSMQRAFGIGANGSSSILGSKSGGNGVKSTSPINLANLPPEQRDYLQIGSQLSAFATQAGLSAEISINMSLEGIIISLSNALVFEPGGIELRPESKQTLHEIAIILKTTDNRIRIEGHTDDVPTNNPAYPTNWELSVARAVAIVRYMVEVEGIDPKKISAAGYAEFQTIASNDSREGRAANRRANIVIIYPNASKKFIINMPNMHDKPPAKDQANSKNE